MMKWLYLPFIIQGLLMLVDESLHLKRHLPRWERVGHPLDTFTVLSCYLFLELFRYTPSMAKFYIGLCVFSCLFITKDEFVHAKNCSAVEHWLHSMMFILHPVTFLSAGIIWMNHPHDPSLTYLPILVGALLIYQTLRWNFSWQFEKK